MKQHSASQLRYWGSILASDGATVLATPVGCDVEDLAGRRLEQAQLEAAETTHMILLRAADAGQLVPSGYISVNLDTGAQVYIVDYTRDPREPRPNMWVEVFCHVERSSA